jgi:Holliday junction resolvase RusA-like endonuclease
MNTMIHLPKLFLKFDLPGPPLAKQRVKVNTITKTAYTPERTARYEGILAFTAADAMAGAMPTEAPLAVILDVRLPIPRSWSKKKQRDAAAGLLRPARKPDADNFAKCLDALNFIVWNDDCQIVDLHILKFYSVVPGLTVTVHCLNAEQTR